MCIVCWRPTVQASEHFPPGFEAVSLLEALNGPLNSSPITSGRQGVTKAHVSGTLPVYGNTSQPHLDHCITSSQVLKLKKSSSKWVPHQTKPSVKTYFIMFGPLGQGHQYFSHVRPFIFDIRQSDTFLGRFPRILQCCLKKRTRKHTVNLRLRFAEGNCLLTSKR